VSRGPRAALAAAGRELDHEPPAWRAWASCVPVPLARPRFDPRSRRTYTSEPSARGARAQAAALAGQGPRQPLDGPVSLRLIYHLTIPRSWSKRRQAEAAGRPVAGKPDVDNLAKLTLDVLSRLGWWRDDAQVVRLEASKVYARDGEAGVEVEVVAL